MVAQVDLRLQTEEVLRVADVLAQRRGHLVERREEVREDRGVRLEQRLVRLHRVEVRLAGVGVDDDLDAVADVVDAVGPVRVRDAVGRRVGVLHPVHVALVDDDVRVGIEPEERRDLADALLDVAAVDEAAVVVERARDEDVAVAELPRVDELARAGC